MFPQRLMDLVNSGKAYMADTSIQSIAIATPFLRGVIANPAGSGRDIWVYNFDAWTSLAAGMSLVVYRDVTTSITANPIVPNNQNGYTNVPASVAAMAWDLNASDLAGGKLLRTIPIVPNTPPYEYNKEIIVIPPGHNIGVSANLGFFGALLAASKAFLHTDWVEQGISQ